jgi:hypothetical protein
MTPRFLALLLVPAFALFACGDDGSPAAGSSSTTEEPGTETTTGDSGTEETTTGGGPAWPYDHGYVKVQFVVPEDAPDQAILDATATVVIRLDYGECLVGFYEDNMDMRQGGEIGTGVFGAASLGGEGWEDLLCSPLFGSHAMCDVVWISQRFDAERSLTITYDVMGELSSKPLFFGPLPTPQVAACPDGSGPSVVGKAETPFRGIDAMGNDLWRTRSYAPMEAASRDDDPITVTIEPLE